MWVMEDTTLLYKIDKDVDGIAAVAVGDKDDSIVVSRLTVVTVVTRARTHTHTHALADWLSTSTRGGSSAGNFLN